MSSIKEKVALITGAGSGLGQSHAALLSTQGAHIIIQDINENGANETERLITALGGSANILVCDIRDTTSFETLFKEITTNLGNVDILINNAGISSQQRSIEEISDDILVT